MQARRKYLKDWAEPEILFRSLVTEPYQRALVVPACREEASLLDGYVAAAETASGSTLCILVVNGPEVAPEAHHEHNARLLEAVRSRLRQVREFRPIAPFNDASGGWPRGSPPLAFLGVLTDRLDVLVVDRASEGARLPPKEGVGLARKIGFDLALALYAAENLQSRWIFGTDADATLPPSFFGRETALSDERLAAATFTFWHTETEDPRVTRATALYEVSLRYYVEGLAWAGSPYAFHTVGSAMAVSADAYAAVRGMPKREAAEDFYLLNKLAKVGEVVHLHGRAVQIASRTSDRTPFGTGASVRQGLESGARSLYSVGCFRVLREIVRALDAFSSHGDVPRFFSDLGELSPEERRIASEVLEKGGARPALEGAAAQARTRGARLTRVHAWFDAFRTLKLVHAIRDGAAANVPWEEALLEAPFLETSREGQGSLSRLAGADEPGLVTLRGRMVDAEADRWEERRLRARETK